MKRKNKRTNKNKNFDSKAKWGGKPSSKKEPTEKKEETAENDGIILNKYIALSGISSRRKAVEFIKKGHIEVNGKVVTIPYQKIYAKDKVKYKGTLISPETKKVYVLLNKPKNCITSLKDPEGRKTVLDLVEKACSERIYPVGRLDRNTTGLLLLTNDGDLAKKLSHPSHGVKKLYYAYLDKPLQQKHLDSIVNGFELEDGKVQVDAAGYVEGSDNYEVGIEIHIGRNRIVRRIFEHFGYQVKKLDRLYYAGLTKKDLPRGRWRHLSPKEVIMLKHFS